MSGEQLVVVGSYAAPDAPGIHAVRVDPDAGTLALVASWSGVTNPSYLALGPDRSSLYAVSETAADEGRPGHVHAFELDLSSPVPRATPTTARPSGGDHPCHLAVDPSGRWLAVANYGSGSVATFAAGPDGELGPMVASVQHRGTGPNGMRQGSPHAHAAVFAPDGRFVVAADLGADRVAVYRVDPGTGALVHHGDGVVSDGDGPRSVAFGPDGSLVAVSNELGDTVTTYRWDGAAGSLSTVDRRSTLTEERGDNLVAAVGFLPEGDRVLVSNRGDDSIAVFGVDAAGRLESFGATSCGGAWPRDLAVVAGGRFVLVANEHSHELALLPIDGGRRSVGAPVARLEVPSPTCITVA